LGKRLRLLSIGSVLALALVILLVNAHNAIEEVDKIRVRDAGDKLSGEVGAYYRIVPENLRVDNMTHLLYIYHNPCVSCDPDRRRMVEESLKVWASNVSIADIQLEMVNSYNSSQAQPYLDSFKIDGSSWGFTTLIVYRNSEAYVFTPPIRDENVQKVISQLNHGSTQSSSGKSLPISPPLVFLLGALSGVNPCFVALASAFLAAARKDELPKVAKRLLLISLGLIYAYLFFFALILSNPAVVGYLPQITWAVALILLGVGVLYILEAALDLYARRWGGGSSIEARIPLFRTPEVLKSRIRGIESSGGLFDFSLGAFFSLVKLPCVAAYLFILLVNSTNQLVDVVVFTFGVVSPIILVGALISLGMIKINQLTELQFKGRILQRIAIGVILIVSVALLL